jgi:hypothetical protein
MGLSQRFDSMSASVGHVKLMIEASKSFLRGNLTGKGDTPQHSWFGRDRHHTARLTLNARVQMEPDTLEGIVREVVVAASQGCITATLLAWRCLSPERPNPTHRYDHVIVLQQP